MSFIQNLTGHLRLKTHKISFSSTNDKWGSANTRISPELTLKGGIMLSASRTHHHIAGHNVMHNLLDTDYCRKAALPVSLLFKHPSHKRSEGHILSLFMTSNKITSNETRKNQICQQSLVLSTSILH
jgi:hypothetical protein